MLSLFFSDLSRIGAIKVQFIVPPDLCYLIANQFAATCLENLQNI